MMSDFFQDSVYFGVSISLAAYAVGMLLRRKTGWSLMNPLLIAIILVIAVLLALGVSYTDYNNGASWLSYLLTPATVCLAVPLYQQVELLKKHYRAILCGILAGVLSSLVTILLLAIAFGFGHDTYVTFLPKSITTAIGMGVSKELGGIVTITVATIIVTGILGSVIADGVFALFHIEEPVARGLALGNASHAIGTAKAIEMGQVEGAMSGLAVAVAGLLTVVTASVFAQFL